MRSRPVPPGRTLVMDRRTTRRFFILRPDLDGLSRLIIYYCLAVLSVKHGILVHAVVQMSTHWHVCLTDVRGVLPDFLHDMHQTLAMCFKAHRGWDESVWNKSQTGVVDLETSGGALKELAYVICNPIEAGMVESIEEYPGAVTRPEQIGRVAFTLKRPAIGYFANEEKWPKTATLRYEIPAVLKNEYGAGANRAIVDATRARAEQLRKERAAKGLGYLGAEAVCAAPITTQSTREEARGELTPTFAFGPAEHEARKRKLAERRAWQAAYAESLERWRRGERDVVWPPHTWKMRVLHGVRCAPPPR